MMTHPFATTACRGLSSLTLTYTTPDNGLTYTYHYYMFVTLSGFVWFYVTTALY